VEASFKKFAVDVLDREGGSLTVNVSIIDPEFFFTILTEGLIQAKLHQFIVDDRFTVSGDIVKLLGCGADLADADLLDLTVHTKV